MLLKDKTKMADYLGIDRRQFAPSYRKQWIDSKIDGNEEVDT
jgi:hypothetical protein